MVQLDQVIAGSFVVALLRKWPFFNRITWFKCFLFSHEIDT